MKVLIYALTDNAGVGIALKQAFDRHGGEWEARFVRRQPSPWGYPADIEWRKGDGVTGNIVARLIRQADVIHLLQRPTLLMAGKPSIVHHLGTYQRRDPAGVAAACRAIGAIEVAGSLDLMPMGNMELLPIVADIERFRAIRERVYQPSDRIRIVHAPTNRALKSTINFVDAMTKLAKRHPIEVDLIEGVPWDECLERKARADILFDELNYGYGANALEAMSMGIPVVSGIADARVRELMVGMFGALPFLEATARSLERVLETLVLDADLRSAMAHRGREHVERFHSEASVVARAVEIYENVVRYPRAAWKGAVA